MTINVTASHKLTFSVQYFEQNEGGMDSGQYGQNKDTLEEALHLLTLARASQEAMQENDRMKHEWVIVVDVATTISKSK